MRPLTFLILATLTILLTNCTKEDHFGYSKYGEIKSIEVSNQAGATTINNTTKTIEIEITAGVALDQLEVLKLEMSSFADASIGVGDILDLTTPFLVSVTSENNTTTQWSIRAVVAASEPQLSNSDFENWYEVAAGYMEPGSDATSTIWGTGNQGGAILNKIATTPIQMNGGNGAHLETLDNGFLGQIAKTPITTATIFTGTFNADNIDINNPRAAVELGTPYTGRPKSFDIKYSYTPGEINKDRDGNTLNYGDEMDMYMLLEVRENGKSRRLATGWFRSGETITELSQLNVQLIYGQLDGTFPDELLPVDGYVPSDSVDFVLPTHISFLATSSYGGAEFEGAVGSTLIVDDLKLVY